MLTSVENCETIDHTITFRESDGVDMPHYYLPNNPEADNLWAIKIARQCDDEDPYCVTYTYDQFLSDDKVLWLERGYLNPISGIGPNIDEYVMSYTITFQTGGGGEEGSATTTTN